MTSLEQLLRHEVEFHRQLREAAGSRSDAAAAHMSFALQNGYEALIRRVGKATGRDVEEATAKVTLCGDTRDVLAARDSVRQLLGLPLFEA